MIFVKCAELHRERGRAPEVCVAFATTTGEEAEMLANFFYRMMNRPIDPYSMRNPEEISLQKEIEKKGE